MAEVASPRLPLLRRLLGLTHVRRPILRWLHARLWSGLKMRERPNWKHTHHRHRDHLRRLRLRRLSHRLREHRQGCRPPSIICVSCHFQCYKESAFRESFLRVIVR